jgi:NitT/TauT family transport system permease protein
MSRIKLLLIQVLVAVAAIAVWHVFSTYEIFGIVLMDPFFFSTPADVAERVVKLLTPSTAGFPGPEAAWWEWVWAWLVWPFRAAIWWHLGMTLTESILAFVIGAAGGIVIGFWFARQPLVAAVFDPYVKMANSLPRIVLAPIFMLWFGYGIWSKVTLGVTLVFFIVFFNVYQGVKEVNPAVLANARMLGMNSRALLRHVYWPSALSWMFSSLHTSVGFAVVGAVVGEYLGSAAGLGSLILVAQNNFDQTGVFAGMFILAVFVIAIDYAVTLVERRLLVWRPDGGRAQ